MKTNTAKKPDHELLKKVFVHNLNRLYFGKTYLDNYMERLIDVASFNNLQLALHEFWTDIRKQILRLEEIYKVLDVKPSDKNCNPLKSIIKEEYCLNEKQPLPVLLDTDLIQYIQMLEHINISSCRMLKLIAISLKSKEIEQLLKECFDEAVDNDELFMMVAKEYLMA